MDVFFESIAYIWDFLGTTNSRLKFLVALLIVIGILILFTVLITRFYFVHFRYISEINKNEKLQKDLELLQAQYDEVQKAYEDLESKYERYQFREAVDSV